MPMDLIVSAAFFAPAMAARRGSRYYSIARTLVRMIWLSIHIIQECSILLSGGHDVFLTCSIAEAMAVESINQLMEATPGPISRAIRVYRQECLAKLG